MKPAEVGPERQAVAEDHPLHADQASTMKHCIRIESTFFRRTRPP